METRASYLLVGTFVLLLFAGIVGFVIWLGKFQFDQVYTRYDIVVAGSVSGLKVGSSVELNGIPVGEVIGIRIEPKDVEKVRVTIEVPSNVPVRSDTKAVLQITGITGGIKVQLSGGTQQAPPLEPKPGETNATIIAKASTLEEFLESAPELIEDVQLLIRRTSNLLNAKNQAAFGETMANVAVITGSLAARTGDIELLISEAASTMENVREASLAMKELSGVLIETTEQLSQSANDTIVSVGATSDTLRDTLTSNRTGIDALVVQFGNAAGSLARTGEQLEAMVAENRGPLRDFTGNGLYELTDLIVEAHALINGLKRVTTDVQRDPARFLFGNQQQGYEAGGERGR